MNPYNLPEEPSPERPPARADGEQQIQALEQRLHRLESALASIQDTRALEERVVERVGRQVQSRPQPVPPPSNAVAESKRQTLAPAGNLAAHLEAAASSLPLPASPNTIRNVWFIVDVWNELRTIVRMFFDVRYHVGWFTRLMTVVLILVILTSQWWMGYPRFLALDSLLDKLLCLILAFVLYKILSREAGRYRQWRAQTPTGIRV